MNVGVDIGKGDVKVSYENELFSFPAIIGEGKDHALETKKKLDVTIGNQRYWVGELAKESFSQVKLFDKNHISEYTRILLLSALYQCPSSEFNVVVGLPIADFQKQKKDLSRLLKGEVKVNEKIIKVNNVSVFPQGVGGLYSQYLSYTGKMIREFPPRVGIVDIGFKDFNFCVLDNGELNHKMSWSFPLGLHTAFMAAIPELNTDTTINDIRPSQVPSYIYDRLKDQIMNLINPYWKSCDFPVFSCGGGSYWVDIGNRVEKAEFANVIGFRKLAVMRYA